MVSRHKAKDLDHNGLQGTGPGTELTRSSVTEDGLSGTELADNGDEMGSC